MLISESPTQSPVASNAEAPRLRLEFLDGLRGLAALYVLLFHIHLTTNFTGLPRWFQFLQSRVAYGHYSVCVFIVLSGFCLMLPVARSTDGELRGGFVDFAQRRARRILPPYYAALLFSLLWTLAYEGAKYCAGHDNSLALEFSPGNILSHIFLVFNVFPKYWGTINGALWSVATEWQIYFIFALLLLPLWRRFGNIATVIVAFSLGLGPHYLLPQGQTLNALNRACPWFIGLFALGMVGASIRYQSTLKSITWQRFPWGTAFVLLSLLLCLIAVIKQPVDDAWSLDLVQHYTWITDTLCGLGTLCLIMFCTYAVEPASENTGFLSLQSKARLLILRFLEARPVMAVGAFSYSLYLVHQPILAALLYVVSHLHMAPLIRALLMWTSGISISISLALLFSRVFERPFISNKQGPFQR